MWVFSASDEGLLTGAFCGNFAVRMIASLSAFDVLVLLVVLGVVSAMAGWAGGWGARLQFAVRVDRVEGALMQLLNRSKGAAGGAVMQVQKARATSAEKEAEQLAAALAAKARAVAKPRMLTDEDALDALEAEAQRRGLVAKDAG